MKIILAMIISFMMATTAMAANSESNFGGIGIDGIPMTDGQIKVGQLVNGGPAHMAGIQAGDIITHIDGKATLGSDFRTMVNKRLRGVAGTQVVLKIRRPGEEKLQAFTLTRRQLAYSTKKEK